MPSKNKNKNGIRSTRTIDSFTWPDEFYVVPRLCFDMTKEVDYK